MIDLPFAKFQSFPECERTIIKLSEKQLYEIGKIFEKRKRRRRKGVGFNNRRRKKMIDNLFKNNILPSIIAKNESKSNCKIKNRKYHANFRKYL